MEAEGKGDPYWWNPCGTSTNPSYHYDDSSDKSDSGSSNINISSVIHAINLSLNDANFFKDSFAQSTVQKSFSEFNDDMKQTLSWLPTREEIPKTLGNKPSENHIKSLKFKEALVDIFHALQKIAVGIEQIVLDEQKYNGNFRENFTKTETQLKNVLCEIHQIIIECNYEAKPNVGRDIIPAEQKNDSNQTSRDINHFLIYRDYMNALEYAKYVFEYFNTTGDASD